LNVLDEQSWSASTGWSSSSGLGEGLMTMLCKIQHVTKCYISLRLGKILWNSIRNGVHILYQILGDPIKENNMGKGCSSYGR
jgi:hypothetical protein